MKRRQTLYIPYLDSNLTFTLVRSANIEQLSLVTVLACKIAQLKFDLKIILQEKEKKIK